MRRGRTLAADSGWGKLMRYDNKIQRQSLLFLELMCVAVVDVPRRQRERKRKLPKNNWEGESKSRWRRFSAVNNRIKKKKKKDRNKPSANIPAALLRWLTTPCVLEKACQMTSRFLCINHESTDYMHKYYSILFIIIFFRPIPTPIAVTCAKLRIGLGLSLLNPGAKSPVFLILMYALGHQLRKPSMLASLLWAKR